MKPKAKTGLPKGLEQGSAAHKWRWIPEPALRKAGWKSATLKNRDDTYMTLGQAVDAAEAINRMAADWVIHRIPPAGAWAHLAPKGLASQPAPIAASASSIGALLDAYMGVIDPVTGEYTTPPHDDFAAMGPTTQADCRGRLNRMVDALAGQLRADVQKQRIRAYLRSQAAGIYVRPNRRPTDDELKAYEAYCRKVEKARSLPVSILGQTNPRTLNSFLQQVANDLADQVNDRTGEKCLTNAKAVITYAHLWLEWCRLKAKVIAINPAADVKCREVKGRKVIWTPAEIDMVLTVAYELGWTSIGHLVEAALELSWDEKSMLSIVRGQHYEFRGARGERRARVAGTRSKTDNQTHTTLTRSGVDLFDRILAHAQDRVGAGVALHAKVPLFVVDHIPGRNDVTATGRAAIGKPWKGDYLRHVLLEIRQEAARRLGDDSVVTKTFADLRDTAFTRMKAAGMDKHKIASRTQQSPESVDRLDHKHYGIVTTEISDDAADLLDQYQARSAAKGV